MKKNLKNLNNYMKGDMTYHMMFLDLKQVNLTFYQNVIKDKPRIRKPKEQKI